MNRQCLARYASLTSPVKEGRKCFHSYSEIFKDLLNIVETRFRVDPSLHAPTVSITLFETRQVFSNNVIYILMSRNISDSRVISPQLGLLWHRPWLLTPGPLFIPEAGY